MIPSLSSSFCVAPSVLKSFVRHSSDVVKRKSTGEVLIRYGPGGRSSVSGHIATVFGCSGFVGRYLVNRLGQVGTQVVTPYRGEKDDRRHLQLMGDLGQIVPLKFSLFDEKSLAECIRHSDVVYNLISRNYETKNFNYTDVNVDGPRLIAKLCREEGVPRLIHLSCLNASADSPSMYLKTKFVGELAVREEFPDATIVRSSTIYGHEDRFLNRMAMFANMPFGAPIMNDGETTLRPVCVSDVATALATMMKDEESVGKTYELYGPKEYSYQQLFDLFCELTKSTPSHVYLPKFAAKFVAKIANLSPHPIMTPDEVERMYISDSPSSNTLKFEDLGINPRNIEYNALEYVRMFRKHDDYGLPGREPVRSH
ncbi:hypothetical protein BKA69DRAFT_1080690 [Paraphysoderma sedebokerense]|nr:hypothetical protein BKA69DRAFT_1080690 [Paraphysoderma sedebokerense]